MTGYVYLHIYILINKLLIYFVLIREEKWNEFANAYVYVLLRFLYVYNFLLRFLLLIAVICKPYSCCYVFHKICCWYFCSADRLERDIYRHCTHLQTHVHLASFMEIHINLCCTLLCVVILCFYVHHIIALLSPVRILAKWFSSCCVDRI